MSLLEQTENAIRTFYNHPNTPEQQAAHQWLLSLQTSPEGWQISWMLLNAQKPVEAQYYGANILHYKISHDVKDIDSSHLDELKTRFPHLLANFCNGPKLVISKLCYCYAALLIQVADEKFELLHCLEDLENHLKSLGHEPKHVIVELITSFATEFKTLNLASPQKVMVRTILDTFIPTFMSMCKHVLLPEHSDDNEIHYQLETLVCLLRWVEVGVGLFDSVELFPIMLSKVSDEELSDKTCEVIIELITAPSSMACHSTIFATLNQLLQLKPLVEKAVADSNQLLVNNICMIFTNMGETHCQLFIKVTESEKQQAVVELVRTILCFTSMSGQYPKDETCSELTLNFWYTLQDDLYSVDISEISDYQKQFVSAYVMLINIFYEKCQFPSDEVYANYSDDDRELFRCYRIDVQDTMLYVYTLLQEDCLRFFLDKLNALIADNSSHWFQFESILHLLRGATESVDTEESTFIPEMLKLLPKLPKHPKVMDSLVFFLGSLSEWLNSHPDEIANVIPILIQGLSNPATATACSFSLKDICHECAMLMNVSLSNEILQACYKGLADTKTPAKIAIRLFEIGGYVVSALPSAEINAQLEILVSPLFQWFKDIVSKENTKKNSVKRLSHYLNCFLGLFRTLDPFEEQVDHPVSIVFGQLIPLFRFLKPWCGIEEVVVAATLCIQKALEISREKLSSHVNLTSECLADFFSVHPFGCILDASSTLIGMFGSVPECTERVKNLYELLMPVCIKIIESGEGRNYPDCLQSFMEFLTRVIKTVPEFLFTNESQQKSVIKCALIILNYPEAPTIKSASNFLITYINFSSCFSSAKEMVEYVGRDIIIQSLLCIGGVAPRHTTDHFAEIILALNKNFVTLLSNWLGEVITREGFPTVNASLTQKEHFKKAVLREKASKRRMKEIVKDFSLTCRGLQGMAYVRSISSLFLSPNEGACLPCDVIVCLEQLPLFDSVHRNRRDLIASLFDHVILL